MNECIATTMLKNLAEYNKYRHVAISNNPTPPTSQFPTRHEENQYRI